MRKSNDDGCTTSAHFFLILRVARPPGCANDLLGPYLNRAVFCLPPLSESREASNDAFDIYTTQKSTGNQMRNIQDMVTEGRCRRFNSRVAVCQHSCRLSIQVPSTGPSSII
ncbi:hypothetical protein VTN49DRAFT_2409 [Thermomyces lanuginosus]|uniref:uncharacterized protein n=1 Tax=Thermomyces lanuginosus TaxID=5541 RepID=UPI003744A7E6